MDRLRSITPERDTFEPAKFTSFPQLHMVLLRGARGRLQEFSSHHRSLSQVALRWSLCVLCITTPKRIQVSPSSCYQLWVWGDLNYSGVKLSFVFPSFQKRQCSWSWAGHKIHQGNAGINVLLPVELTSVCTAKYIYLCGTDLFGS